MLGSLLALCCCCCCWWWLFLLCCGRRRKKEKQETVNFVHVESASSEVGIPVDAGVGAPLPPHANRATEMIDLDAKRTILATWTLGRGTSVSTATTGRGTSVSSVAIPQRMLTTREQHAEHV